MRKLLNIALAAGMSTTLPMVAGCYQPVSGSASNRPHVDTGPTLPKAGPQQIVVDARLAYSAEENRPAVEAIVERARALESEGTDGLQKLVQRWPDVALDLLRDSIAAESDYQIRAAIARSYDQAFGITDPSAGWYAALSTSASQPERYRGFRDGRTELLKLLQSGHFPEAANLDLAGRLPQEAPSSLRVEAQRLRGVAYLLNDKPDRAAELLIDAAVLAMKGPRHPQFEIGLLLCEAQRRRGSIEQATTIWKQTISQASSANVRDPALWERAILSKPADAAWPAIGAIADSDGAAISRSSTDVGDVLLAIGKMRFTRHAFQPSLLAFSRAEAETNVKSKQDLSRLYRAQALIALQQPASALPVLDNLIQSANPQIARRAKAVQGDVLCRVLDDRRHGIPLLREALAAPASDFPGASQFTVNLGFYCILEGLDEEGFRRLHEAEARLESEGRSEELAEALKNEAACLRFDKKQSEADAVQNRADNLCRKYGLAIGPLTAATDRSDTSASLPRQ